MSHYSSFMKERQGAETIESDFGFVSYVIEGETCFICDIFVHPDFRSNPKKLDLLQSVLDAAKVAGCKKIEGHIWTNSKNSDHALKAALKHGFKPEKNLVIRLTRGIDG